MAEAATAAAIRRRLDPAIVLAAGVLVASAVVALSLPVYSCRPGWFHWGSGLCGLRYDDDWGYQARSAIPLKTAIGAVGIAAAATIVLERAHRMRLAATVGVVAFLAILWPLTAWSPSVPSTGWGYQPEVVGEVAAGLRCPDPACAGMSVEEAVTRSYVRYPGAQRYWRLIEERLARGATSASVRSYFANRFGSDALI